MVVADAGQLPFIRESFDIANCIAVLGELPEPTLAIQEISSVIRHGGGFSISEILPDPDYPTAETVLDWSADSDLTVDARVGNLMYYTIRFRKN
jgi:ubiquinone/menaquinone biosynthesis C-methylase UbiE